MRTPSPHAVLLAALVATTGPAALAQPLSAEPTRRDEAAAPQDSGGRRAASLEETLALVSKNSPDLEAARAQVDQVVAKVGQLYSVLKPEVKATLSYVYTSTEQKFALSSFSDALVGVMEASVRGAGPAYGIPYQANDQVVGALSNNLREQLAPNMKDVTIVAHNSLYGGLTVSQVLFSPQFFLLPAADESVRAATFGGLEAREQVLLGAARLYLALEGLTQIEAAARDAEAVGVRREKDASARAEAGVATDIDLLRAKSETAQARSLLANLTGQRQALLAMLDALTGDAVMPAPGRPTRLDVRAEPETSAPWEGTFAVKSDTLALSAQRRFNTADRVSWAPTLVAQAKASYNSNSGFAGTSWILDGIVAAEWQLYDRGMRYQVMHENDAKTAQAAAQLAAKRVKAKATWLGATANLRAAEVALVQAESMAVLAARAQKQAEGASGVGMLTSLELSDIDSRRFMAASAVAQARAQLELRKVEVAAAEGRLATLVGLAQPGR